MRNQLRRLSTTRVSLDGSLTYREEDEAEERALGSPLDQAMEA